MPRNNAPRPSLRDTHCPRFQEISLGQIMSPPPQKNACLLRSDVTLFRIKLCADLISSVEIRSYWTRVGPKAGSRPARERRERAPDTGKEAGEGGGGRPQGRGHCPGTLRPPGAGRGGQGHPRGSSALPHLIGSHTSGQRSVGGERRRFGAGSRRAVATCPGSCRTPVQRHTPLTWEWTQVARNRPRTANGRSTRAVMWVAHLLCRAPQEAAMGEPFDP